MTPLATYRLQLHAGFTFDDAAELVPYLAALGISDCYIAPFLQTASGSAHGYDVADHNAIRAELGGEPALRRFAEALRRHGMGLLVDVVPNHMGIDRNRNAWWADVLENGPSSAYAVYFDIDWKPAKAELANKVLLPILGDQYGTVLEAGQLRLELTDGTFVIRYYETVLPVAPASYGRILSHRLETLQEALGAEHPALLRLKSLVSWFVTLAAPPTADPQTPEARRDAAATGRRRLAELLAESAEIRAFVEDNVTIFNGTPGDSRSFDLLDALLDQQAYRLAFWRVAGDEINYRRFFDVNELAAIRMEDPRVFEATHRLIVRLVREGVVTGLRIDHPDGLYAPAEYFRRLQRACGGDERRGPLYIVAEKILAPGEELPEAWAVAGTTGYEFLNVLNGIFVDRREARAMDQIYTRICRERPSFAEIVYVAKRLVMETVMASELNMLGQRLNVISEKHRSSRDFTLRSLTRALREIIASFPVYRTYLGESMGEASDRDREVIARAIGLAKGRTPWMSASIYDWIAELLTLSFPAWADERDRQERTDWVMRFQQLTAPVTAKGYEDTALYRYHRLLSLNEVGGDPSRFGTALAEFHAANAARLRQTPHALSATSTHDTKRSEDVRARINVLSEIPGEWRRRVGRWQRLNRRHRAVVDGVPVPGPAEEYFIYQTLVGAWPITLERFQAYLAKAIREAKLYTSWINPNPRYDAAMLAFAERILDPRRSRHFLGDFAVFHARVAHFGVVNALAQTLVKITAPGVPDFYQGTELWELSLVDPDNRRPVDFATRRKALDALLAEIASTPDLAALARDLWKCREDGRVKLYVIARALAVRRSHAELFGQGEYEPIEVVGPFAEQVCAYLRTGPGAAVLTVVPRLTARRGVEEPLGPEYWSDTHLTLPATAGARFRNVLTGEVVEAGGGPISLGTILASFPVALLERQDG